MNAIQTFWAAPGLAPDRIHGGWLDPRFHFMSWALSASLLNANFGHTVLHTDVAGSHLLIDLLQLPYKEVQLTQEGLGSVYPEKWWVLRKINSYAQSDQSFLHVDGDAFLWNGLPVDLQNKPVIAQNDQSGFQCYDVAAKQLNEAGIPLPHFFTDPIRQFNAVNTGIVGGTDVDFFKGFAAELKTYFETSLSQTFVRTLNTGYLNTLLEECFLRHYADYFGKPIETLISQKPDEGYSSLANSMYESYGITHVVGTNKKDIYYCRQVELQLKRRFPETFRKVERFVENSFKNKTAFSFPNQDLFPESNLLVKRTHPERNVNPESCQVMETEFRAEGKTDLVQIIRFEHSRYNLFVKLNQQRDELAKNQQQRLAVLTRMLDHDAEKRMNDIVKCNEQIPVMNFKYPGKSKPYFLAAAYDFSFGYSHIAHRSLDGIAMLILLSTEKPLTVGNLIALFFRKTSGTIDEEQRALLLQKLDLKLKELLFLGLIDYKIADDSMSFQNSGTESAEG